MSPLICKTVKNKTTKPVSQKMTRPLACSNSERQEIVIPDQQKERYKESDFATFCLNKVCKCKQHTEILLYIVAKKLKQLNKQKQSQKV